MGRPFPTRVMPLDVPESVLACFKGKLQPGITLCDLVNAIPLHAIKAGLLAVAKQGKKNIFSERSSGAFFLLGRFDQAAWKVAINRITMVRSLNPSAQDSAALLH